MSVQVGEPEPAAAKGKEYRPEFTDAESRLWSLRLRFGHFDSLKAIGVDVANLEKNNYQGVDDLLNDVAKLGEFAWVLLNKNAKERNVEKENFLDAIDDMTALGDAVLGAYLSFIPTPRRLILETVLAKGEEVLTTITTAISNGPVTRSPESSASIPPGSASAS